MNETMVNLRNCESLFKTSAKKLSKVEQKKKKEGEGGGSGEKHKDSAFNYNCGVIYRI